MHVHSANQITNDVKHHIQYSPPQSAIPYLRFTVNLLLFIIAYERVNLFYHWFMVQQSIRLLPFHWRHWQFWSWIHLIEQLMSLKTFSMTISWFISWSLFFLVEKYSIWWQYRAIFWKKDFTHFRDWFCVRQMKSKSISGIASLKHL